MLPHKSARGSAFTYKKNTEPQLVPYLKTSRNSVFNYLVELVLALAAGFLAGALTDALAVDFFAVVLEAAFGLDVAVDFFSWRSFRLNANSFKLSSQSALQSSSLIGVNSTFASCTI